MTGKATDRKRRTTTTNGSVWLRPAKATREEPPLTRARIVEEAVVVLDERGIEGLTMRRLAEQLGSGVMTLYWHVNNKDDVIDLALDAIFAELPRRSEGVEADRWREDIISLLLDWRETMLRHPWSAALLQRPALGPNLLDRLEFLHASLTNAGLTGQRLNASTWTLYNYVMGATVARASLNLSPKDQEIAQERLRSMSNRYPTLSAHDYLLDSDWDGTFIQGLEYILNGIAKRS